MITCKDCKHWEIDEQDKWKGYCDRLEGYDDTKENKDGVMCVLEFDWPDQGGSATIYTGEDFGCIHGIKKEEKHG